MADLDELCLVAVCRDQDIGLAKIIVLDASSVNAQDSLYYCNSKKRGELMR